MWMIVVITVVGVFILIWLIGHIFNGLEIGNDTKDKKPPRKIFGISSKWF
jgi:hypothetical protein